ERGSMVEKKGQRRHSRPPADLASELKAKRAEFVHTFFKRGAEFTEELVTENERLRGKLASLEAENAKMRTQLAKDKAVRELVGAQKLALFVLDDAKKNLVAIAVDGIAKSHVAPIALHGASTSGAAATIERVFLTGVAHVGDVKRASLDAPAACVPMRVEDDV